MTQKHMHIVFNYLFTAKTETYCLLVFWPQILRPLSGLTSGC